MPYAMVGGGGPDSTLSRAGKERVGERYLADISFAGGPQPIVAGEVAAVRRALDGWGVTGIVLPNPRLLPEYEQVFLVRSIVVLMTAATGEVPTYRGPGLGVVRRRPRPTAARSGCRPAGPVHGRAVDRLRSPRSRPRRRASWHLLRRGDRGDGGRALGRRALTRWPPVGTVAWCVRRSGRRRGSARSVGGPATSAGRVTRAGGAGDRPPRARPVRPAGRGHVRTSATGRERVVALDGLRAFGLLLIMGFHFGVGWLRGDSSAWTSSTSCPAT